MRLSVGGSYRCIFISEMFINKVIEKKIRKPL